MLLNSLNTGSTDLRDTEVQQPNTTETLSLVISSRAFSANNGQFDAGSTTTASSFLPSTPPFLFCSSMRNSIVSFSVVSLMAIVPESEWRIPTLMVFWAAATLENTIAAASSQAATNIDLRFIKFKLLGSDIEIRSVYIWICKPIPAFQKLVCILLNLTSWKNVITRALNCLMT